MSIAESTNATPIPDWEEDQILLLAIGNDGREDDGLGWAFAQAVRDEGLFRGEVAFRFQLQVEDAELIKDFEGVIFVDSWKTSSREAFCWVPCVPEASNAFSTHALSPPALLHLSQVLYEKTPPAYLLGIRGDSWNLRLGLSPAGKTNLEAALRAWKKKSLT